MRLEVYNTIETLLTSDKSVTARERRDILAVCRGQKIADIAPRMMSATEIVNKFNLFTGRRIAYATIKRWADSGRLPYVQVSATHRMYREADVIRLFCGEDKEQESAK